MIPNPTMRRAMGARAMPVLTEAWAATKPVKYLGEVRGEEEEGKRARGEEGKRGEGRGGQRGRGGRKERRGRGKGDRIG